MRGFRPSTIASVTPALLYDGLLYWIVGISALAGGLIAKRLAHLDKHPLASIGQIIFIALIVSFLAATWREPVRNRAALWATPDWLAATPGQRMAWRLVAGGAGGASALLSGLAIYAAVRVRALKRGLPLKADEPIERDWDGD